MGKGNKNNIGKAIVITSGKGGVGKTTTSANIGAGLAIAGYSVVLVDADIGLRNLDVVIGLENRIVYDIMDVAEKRCKVRQALIKDKRWDGLNLLPAAQTRDKSALSPDQMKDIITMLKRQFDFVIIDSPAGIEQGFQYSIAGADEAIIVTTPEVSAVRDADRVIGLLEANGVSDPQLIINRIRPDMVKRGDMMTTEDIVDILAIELLGIVPDDETVVISTNKGEPVVGDQKTKPGKAYNNVVQRILDKNVPIITLETPNENPFARVFKLLFGM